ncbi:MAG: hypothetical protein R3F59_13105 [Myxococcota bacterium]
MRAWVLLGVAMGCSGGHPPPEAAVPPPEPLPPLEPHDPVSVAAHLELPASVEAQRGVYAQRVVAAEDTVALFAAAHGWREQVPERPFEGVALFDTPEALWARLAGEAPPPAALPPAALEAGALLVVTEAGYRASSPDRADPPDAWTRLVAHELVHGLQGAVLAADGRPAEAVGPHWFAEGLAVLGSGQDFDTRAGLVYASAEEALAGVGSGDPATALTRYAAAVRYFARREPLPALVARAGDPGFEDSLR